MSAVHELLVAGAVLPELGDFEDKHVLGPVYVEDTYREWPLTFVELVDSGCGQATLTLEIDAEHGPILTFDIAIDAQELAAVQPPPELNTADAFWRAVTAVAATNIAEGVTNGAIPVPEPPCSWDLTIDPSEALRVAQDPVALRDCVARNPLTWTA